MAIDKYICSTFEEQIDKDKAVRRILYSYHKSGYERKFFEGLLDGINQSPFPVSIIDGIVKNSPMDPSPENPLTKELQWVAFHSVWGREWQVLRHNGYILMPYSDKVKCITPLISVEFHTRKYLGKPSTSGGLQTGDIQVINRVRHDQGRTNPIAMTYDPKNKEERQKKRRKQEIPDNELTLLLDEFEIDNLNAPTIGLPHVLPNKVSSGQIHEVRSNIWNYMFGSGNELPIGWGTADFNDHLTMMKPFYNNKKVEFIDLKLK